jgi:hypothetical protein
MDDRCQPLGVVRIRERHGCLILVAQAFAADRLRRDADQLTAGDQLFLHDKNEANKIRRAWLV